MPITQFFETTVVDTDHNLSAHIFVVPARAFPDGSVPDRETVVNQLEGSVLEDLQSGFLLLPLARVLYAADSPNEALGPQIQIPNAYISFAETLISTRLIPFESSPLSAESLGEIAAKASSRAIGTVIGCVIAGPTPWLLLTVPLGIVVCGAASGVAGGLESGLRQHVRRMISGRSRKRK